jgi:hypothetical protein
MLHEGDDIPARKVIVADHLRGPAEQVVASAQLLFERQPDEGDGIRIDNQLVERYLKMAANQHSAGADVAFREWLNEREMTLISDDEMDTQPRCFS